MLRSYWSGHVGRIDSALLAEAALDPAIAFVYGSHGFVEAATDLLLESGVDRSRSAPSASARPAPRKVRGRRPRLRAADARRPRARRSARSVGWQRLATQAGVLADSNAPPAARPSLQRISTQPKGAHMPPTIINPNRKELLMTRTGDSPREIGTRVRIEGVVMRREKYGVSVRLPDGTIQSFSDRAVSPAEPESSAELRAQLLRAEQDAISSGEVWDEASVATAELRIDSLKAQLGESLPGIHENHLDLN
jgi:hypothetical protein